MSSKQQLLDYNKRLKVNIKELQDKNNSLLRRNRELSLNQKSEKMVKEKRRSEEVFYFILGSILGIFIFWLFINGYGR